MIFTAICGSIFSLLADMPRDYYPNSLEGKNGAELKTELHNLLKNHTRLPYGSRDYNRIACTWTVFKKSDVRPNGKVWDMYSNNSYNFSLLFYGECNACNTLHIDQLAAAKPDQDSDVSFREQEHRHLHLKDLPYRMLKYGFLQSAELPVNELDHKDYCDQLTKDNEE